MPKLRLQGRERLVVMVGGIALVSILIYWAFQGPYDAYKNSKTQVMASRTRLQQAMVWQAEIDEARRKEGAILRLMQSSVPGFDLWTHVDRAVRDSNLVGRAEVQSHRTGASAASNMTAVDLNLNGISTQELVDLLHRIYDTESFVALQRLDQLKPSLKGQGLDCKIVFVAPKL